METPFAFSDDRKPGAVDDEVVGLARGNSTELHVEPQATTRECRVIGRGQVDAHHADERVQESFRLTQRQVEHQSRSQRGFDGQDGVPQLATALAHADRLSRGDGFRRQPNRDVASLDEGTVRRRGGSYAMTMWTSNGLATCVGPAPRNFRADAFNSPSEGP